MSNAVGTFAIDDSFNITGRGLVLLGKVSGQVAAGYQLVFDDATRWDIKAVEFINVRNQHDKDWTAS
jgi:selenocysteine-specific translation elongation factor